MTSVLTRDQVDLTAAQRYQFETDGYVVVPELISPDTVTECRQVLDRMKADPNLTESGVGKKWDEAHYVHFGPILEYDPIWLRMLRTPAITSIIDSLVGGPTRFGQIEAIINRRPDDANVPELRQRQWNTMAPGFHRGIRSEMNIRERNGKRYFNWVKALVMLTDVGPDDGGTLVIRGSQYSTLPKKEMIAAAQERTELVAQATGPAGSVLFLCESVVHSTSMILSEQTRYMLLMGYVPTWAQCFSLHEPSPQYVAAQDPENRTFLLGGDRYWTANPTS